MVGKGKERKGIHTHTHGNGWMCCAALRYNAMRCNGMEMGRDFAVVVVSCFLLFKERARLIGAAAAAAIAGYWLSKFTIRMQCNGIEVN